MKLHIGVTKAMASAARTTHTAYKNRDGRAPMTAPLVIPTMAAPHATFYGLFSTNGTVIKEVPTE